MRLKKGFAERLNQICDEAGISKKRRSTYLGQVCQVTHEAARRWLSPKEMSYPSTKHALEITGHFQRSYQWLMTGEDCTNQQPWNESSTHPIGTCFAIISILSPSGCWVMLDSMYRFDHVCKAWRCLRTGQPLPFSQFCWADTCQLLKPLNTGLKSINVAASDAFL